MSLEKLCHHRDLPMKWWKTWITDFSFMFARAKPSTLASLLGLNFIHFARWAIVRRNQWPDLGQGKQDLANDYLLFCSNFNGTWDQYIDAFADGFPAGWISSGTPARNIRNRFR